MEGKVEHWSESDREEARRLISRIDGVRSVNILEGTKGRPLDSIYITADPAVNPKYLVRVVEVLIKNAMNRTIDYRIVIIHSCQMSELASP